MHYDVGMADTPEKILQDDCPKCGQPPRMVMSPQQAFCGNENCDVFNWDMTSAKEDFQANVTYHCFTHGTQVAGQPTCGCPPYGA